MLFKYCIIGLIISVAINCSPSISQAQLPYDYSDDWILEPGFSIELDSEGFDIPTSIAFVPNPGQEPTSPLYFITELGGVVKVVTNDRSVHVFSDDIAKAALFASDDSKKEYSGAFGLAGICLDSESGFIFVTFAYDDPDGILRNGLIRYESEPETFSTTPSGTISFSEMFVHENTNPHQIGPCQTHGTTLFVAIGDGGNPSVSQDNESFLGKIVRMNFDGSPVTDNPFYVSSQSNATANYIWAKGFRNPFGMKVVDGRVFVADNGIDIDRFMEVRAGSNFLWDATDLSIATNSDFTIMPGNGVVQLDKYPANSPLFPEEYRNKLFLGVSGDPYRDKEPRVLMIEYDLDVSAITSTPDTFLQHRGSTDQIIGGTAFGVDGLYVVPLLPNRQGVSGVYRILYTPEQSSAYVFDDSPEELINKYGCRSCHLFNPGSSYKAPSLDQPDLSERILNRLSTPEYLRQVTALNDLNEEPFSSYASARDAILAADEETKVRLWIKNRLLEPKFDNPNALMPKLNIDENEADILAEYLVSMDTPQRFEGLMLLFPEPRVRNLLYFFVAGAIMSGLFFFTVGVLTHKIYSSRRRNKE